jgi:rod shape-determining protein MreC
MEVILNRYRNVSALLLAVVLQLALLGYQVKSNGEVRLIRVWAVSAVTPLARVIETGRGNTVHFFRDYFVLLDARDNNKRLQAELDRVQMENQYLRTELSTADRARSLSIFQQSSQSKTIASKVIGNATGAGSKTVIIDRGTSSGIEKGMAVITPAGIVGKVTGAFPTASFVLLITDPSFAAGVLSQQNRVHGTLKGQGNSTVIVDYVQNEQKIEQGEWFYTSGDDLIFPKGMPVGQVSVVRNGKFKKEIFVTPSGMQNGLEEVLVVVEGIHGNIPPAPAANQPVHLQDPAAPETTEAVPAPIGAPGTDADRMMDRYRKIGEVEKHVYGGHGGGAPNYNIQLNSQQTSPLPSQQTSPQQTAPSGSGAAANAPVPSVTTTPNGTNPAGKR